MIRGWFSRKIPYVNLQGNWIAELVSEQGNSNAECGCGAALENPLGKADIGIMGKRSSRG
jgi:hypothetical protein